MSINAIDVKNRWNGTAKTNDVLDDIIEKRIVINGYMLFLSSGQQDFFAAKKDGEKIVTFTGFGQLPPYPGTGRSALRKFLNTP